MLFVSNKTPVIHSKRFPAKPLRPHNIAVQYLLLEHFNPPTWVFASWITLLIVFTLIRIAVRSIQVDVDPFADDDPKEAVQPKKSRWQLRLEEIALRQSASSRKNRT